MVEIELGKLIFEIRTFNVTTGFKTLLPQNALGFFREHIPQFRPDYPRLFAINIIVQGIIDFKQNYYSNSLHLKTIQSEFFSVYCGYSCVLFSKNLYNLAPRLCLG